MLFATGTQWYSLLKDIWEQQDSVFKMALELHGQGGDLARLLAEGGVKTLAAVAPAQVNELRESARAAGLANRLLFVANVPSLWHYVPPSATDLVVLPNAAVNLLADAKALGRLCKRVALVLRPGGLFVLDFLTKQGLTAHYDGTLRLVVSDDSFLQIDQGRYNQETRQARVKQRLFLRRGDCWQESNEEVTRYGFSVAQYRCALGGPEYEIISQSPWPHVGAVMGKVALEKETHVLIIARRR